MDGSGKTYEINEPSIVSETIDGEVVIINLDQGSYYSLRGSAAEIWEGLQDGHGAGALRRRLEARFQGDTAEMEHAVSDFLSQLLKEEILRPGSNDAAASDAPISAAAVAQEEKSPFQMPLLEKFTDMEHLLLLDPIHEVDDVGWPNLK